MGSRPLRPEVRPPDPMVVDILAEARRRGISPAALANLAGINASTLSLLRRGYCGPSLHTARQLASAVGLAVVLRPVRDVLEAGDG